VLVREVVMILNKKGGSQRLELDHSSMM
jgi:hypothetical protein